MGREGLSRTSGRRNSKAGENFLSILDEDEVDDEDGVEDDMVAEGEKESDSPLVREVDDMSSVDPLATITTSSGLINDSSSPSLSPLEEP